SSRSSGCVVVWLATMCPCSCTRRTTSGSRRTYLPHMKNVARTPSSASRSAKRSVFGPRPSPAVIPGPSSKVRHRVRSGSSACTGSLENTVRSVQWSVQRHALVAAADARDELVHRVLARSERSWPEVRRREPALHGLAGGPVLGVRQVPELHRVRRVGERAV